MPPTIESYRRWIKSRNRDPRRRHINDLRIPNPAPLYPSFSDLLAVQEKYAEFVQADVLDEKHGRFPLGKITWRDIEEEAQDFIGSKYLDRRIKEQCHIWWIRGQIKLVWVEEGAADNHFRWAGGRRRRTEWYPDLLTACEEIEEYLAASMGLPEEEGETEVAALAA